MTAFPYNLDMLHEREIAFGAKHNHPPEFFARLHDIRRGLIAPDAPDSHKIAVWVVAPVLAAFAAWLEQNIHTHNAYPLGVMREGRLLCRLMKHLFGMESQEADFNRSLSMLTAAHCGDDEALVNWLVRTRIKPLTHDELAKILPEYVAPVDQLQDSIDLAIAQKLVVEWRKLGAASPVYALTKSAHTGVWRHWQNLTSHIHTQPIALMDFACAGNIQRSLQTILKTHQSNTHVVGFNFLTTSGAIWAKQQGCEFYGFLAEEGKPEWIADAYSHAPDVIEICVAAPLGALREYAQDGSALRETSLFNETQCTMVEDWQSLILTAAKTFYDHMGAGLSPELCRCLWGRLLLDPLPSEVMALAEWPIDTGLADYAARPLAPNLEGEPEAWTKIQSGWPAASLLRKRLHM